MFKQKNKFIHTHLKVTFIILFIIFALISFSPLAQAQTDNNPLRAAWQKASDIGRYQFRTTLLQTEKPTPRLENIGRQETQERIILTGDIDKYADTLSLVIDPEKEGQPSVEFKTEKGVAYARQADGEWEIMDNDITELFAPGGDPLGALVAAENIRLVTSQETDEIFSTKIVPPAYLASVTRYRYELNNRKYAEFMQQSFQKHLAQNEGLPLQYKACPQRTIPQNDSLG